MTSLQDVYVELTNIAAGNVATVLARLLDCTLLIEPPRSWLVSEEGALSVFPPEQRAVLIHTTLDGALPSEAALMLSADACWDVVERLLGKNGSGDLDERARSALSEMGNIAISAAANALSEIAQGVVIPSLPRLDIDGEVDLGRVSLDGAPRRVMETELVERGGPLRIRFLWLPEPE